MKTVTFLFSCHIDFLSLFPWDFKAWAVLVDTNSALRCSMIRRYIQADRPPPAKHRPLLCTMFSLDAAAGRKYMKDLSVLTHVYFSYYWTCRPVRSLPGSPSSKGAVKSYRAQIKNHGCTQKDLTATHRRRIPGRSPRIS